MEDGRLSRRAALLSSSVLAAPSLVGVASAHEGAAHASIPHRVLFAVTALGVVAATGVWYLSRRGILSDTATLAGFVVGASVAVLGAIGLVEIQVEPQQANLLLTPWYPIISMALLGVVLIATVTFGIMRWGYEPRYWAAGVLLAVWVGYPGLIPSGGTFHPLGYVTVLALPLVLAWIVRRDVYPALSRAATDGHALWTVVATSCLFAVFFLFSAGLFSTNPDVGVNSAGVTVPTETFVVYEEFADPLVMWPAVEFYIPAVPLFGALSVGTAVLAAVLVGLVGVNTAMGVYVWRSGTTVASRGVLGGVFGTGATACCCCAPAFYGVLSAAVGGASTPVYWTFVDSSSPVGSLFFVTAVGLMTVGAVRMARSMERSERV